MILANTRAAEIKIPSLASPPVLLAVNRAFLAKPARNVATSARRREGTHLTLAVRPNLRDQPYGRTCKINSFHLFTKQSFAQHIGIWLLRCCACLFTSRGKIHRTRLRRRFAHHWRQNLHHLSFDTPMAYLRANWRPSHEGCRRPFFPAENRRQMSRHS